MSVRRRPRPAPAGPAAARGGRPRPPAGRATDGRRTARRPRPRWGLRLAAAVSTLVLLTAGVGHAMVTSLDGNLDRVDPFQSLDNRPEAGPGTNILLIGNDSREGVTEEQRQRYQIGGEGCNCADVILLVHLSEDHDRASVVGLPRDSYAELPAHTTPDGSEHDGHPDKLNAALSRGGPGLMVSTVEEATGVRIDHYVEVNFLSFMRGVDEIGGVDVCTVEPLHDEKSGLDLPAGTSTLSGGEALQYVRARSIDPSADFGRMQRQQRFLASFLDRAVSADVLLNPARLRSTAEVMLDAVRVDPDFGTTEIVALGRAMQGFGTDNAELASVPVDGGQQLPHGGSAITWDTEAAGELFAALREDQPLTGGPDDAADAAGGSAPDAEGGGDGGDGADEDTEGRREVADAAVVPVETAPQEITVTVENATAREGVATRVDEALAATGFATTGVAGDTDGGVAEGAAQSRTTITHGPDQRQAADALRTAVPGAQLREVADHGEQLLLAVGDDYDGVQRVRDGRQPVSGDEVGDGDFAATTGDRVLCD